MTSCGLVRVPMLLRDVISKTRRCLPIGMDHRLHCSTSPVSGTDTSTIQPEEGSLPKTREKGGFAKAIAKLEGHESFPKMLRNCPLMQMGDPEGKIVEGTIYHIVQDDLYIDFGSKFPCVCTRPVKNPEAYIIGRKVRLLVHSLELSTRFLGAKTDLTILEADCTLLGLARRTLTPSSSSSVSTVAVE